MPMFANGMAEVVPAFSEQKEWIREHLWVEAEFDSDKDGKRDRVHVDVTRQRQTETEGLKVPVIYQSSPYFAGTGDGGSILWDVKHELGAVPPPRTKHPIVSYDPNRTIISNSLIREWVPRGFAIVHSEAPGTGRSTGAVTVGGVPERFAPKAVIDWLCGRAKGFTTVDGSEQVFAKWCTGKIGMTGTSYEGTLPVAAATTGVKGLEAIIPVAPNTSYYHYYRSNGLVRHPGGWLGEDVDSLFDFINTGDPKNRFRGEQLYRDGEFAKNQDRMSGDYNAFWAERDLLPYAKNIKCAVLMAHAFNDWNVVPEHSVRISEAVRGKVPLVQYFHQGGHGGDPPFELMNKWFTRFLYGVDNGVERGPKAFIVRETAGRRGAPTPYADYPNPESKSVVLFPTQGETLSLTNPLASVKQEITDDVAYGPADLANATTSKNRLIFSTPELKAPLHLSGTAQISLRLSSSTPAANLTAYLVQLPWIDGAPITTNIVTRGWADPQNASALKKPGDFHSLLRGTPLKPDQFVEVTFNLQPDDQIIPAGRKLGLMIFSSDREFTLWPKAGTKLTVDLAGTKLTLPVVGGASSFVKATSI
ncbi:MAG: Xaa-Pro dipeptidyl-peptidase [Armatimonadetes bacterium Cent15-Ar3]|nr:MAG: Xaa-Pro dipeptidyl-peptidase [Armatimonadetes bacterium Cent15-Ar3]